jgi:hypothetical protein
MVNPVPASARHRLLDGGTGVTPSLADEAALAESFDANDELTHIRSEYISPGGSGLTVWIACPPMG